MRLLLVSSILWVTSRAMRKPDLYVWLEQNSYICDLSLFGSSLPHFVSPDEARQFACDCGDPLISRAACARRGNEVPNCHEIPDLCMREYSILFTETGDRLAPTTNIMDVIKMSKTEQLIAELTNRLRAMGHKEPEHPLKGLEELFLVKTRPTTTTKTTGKPPVTTTKPTFTTTTSKPTITTLRATTNIMDVIKMSKTEQLIAELTNRLRAMGHKEPEHPLKGLEELFLVKTRPTTTTTTTTPEPTTKKTTKKPEIVDEEVRNKAKITSAEMNTREKQAEKKLPQVEGTIRQVPAVDEKIQMGPEKMPMVTVKSNPADVGVKSSETMKGPEMNEIAPFPPQEQKSEDQLIQADPTQFRKPEAEKEPKASRNRKADVTKNENSQPKKSKAPWDNQEDAIEFLRKKVEQLEFRLKETFERRAIPAAKEFSNPDDLVASDDEVVNIRRQSRLDSRRRNTKTDFMEENSFLKSLDDIEKILADVMPTREEQKLVKKEEKQAVDTRKRLEKGKEDVKEVVEGSGNEKPDPDITVMITTTDKAPYTSVELLTHEPESSTSMSRECMDTHELCPTWKTGQLCLTSPMFMYKFCRKTCGMC
ncbi:hypothetical protein ANCCAN_14218 [Ancylostoma caninum]|uniref:ShKT domain-containing protein n=1 Tax=Ancylostoma caninum TaxID=29170 RepID=A0A368G678_ANCCA|nr:hypothetical protein ANCCAN_14218 [Ancylostoma caninum]